MPFTQAGYRELVQEIMDRGYEVRGYGEAVPDERQLILRHDIDMSTQAALDMAKTERELGVTATYFVLTRSRLYNPLAADHAGALRGILDLGHQIGLHFDASFYPDADQAEFGAAMEIALLESFFEVEIRAISFHRPIRELLDGPPEFLGRVNAYGRRYFSEMAYVSDSRGAWNHGHPLEHPCFKKGQAMQLLTHPIWWWGDQPQSPAERLFGYLHAAHARADRALAEECEVHEPGRLGLEDVGGAV